ncbi:Hypothetical protein D9617_13g101070 [Elsinoe fawcettii]|nr:Hypothetical protein D9617_13g101070 [Elsinoe fawcettii]
MVDEDEEAGFAVVMPLCVLVGRSLPLADLEVEAMVPPVLVFVEKVDVADSVDVDRSEDPEIVVPLELEADRLVTVDPEGALLLDVEGFAEGDWEETNDVDEVFTDPLLEEASTVRVVVRIDVLFPEELGFSEVTRVLKVADAPDLVDSASEVVELPFPETMVLVFVKDDWSGVPLLEDVLPPEGKLLLDDPSELLELFPEDVPGRVVATVPDFVIVVEPEPLIVVDLLVFESPARVDEVFLDEPVELVEPGRTTGGEGELDAPVIVEAV